MIWNTQAILWVALVLLLGCAKDPVNPLGQPEIDENETNTDELLYDVNLAYEAQATASSYTDGEFGNPFNLVDGKRSVLNHSFGLLQTTTNEEGWIKIKLNKQQEINEVKIYPKQGGEGVEGYPEGFRIQVSNDDENWETVVEKVNQPLPSSIRGESYGFSNKSAQYVRLYITHRRHIENMWTPPGGVYDAQLAEIEVYLRRDGGSGGNDDVLEGENLGIGGQASTTSEVEEGREPLRAIDGVVDQPLNFFGTASKAFNYEADLTIELIKEQQINEIILYPKVGGDEEEKTVEGFPVDFELQTSENGTDWSTVIARTDFDEAEPVLGKGISFKFDSVPAKYVRILASKLQNIENMWTPPGGVYIMQLAEIEVYLNR